SPCARAPTPGVPPAPRRAPPAPPSRRPPGAAPPPLSPPRLSFGAEPLAAVKAEVAKRHDEGVQRLQQWVKQPSIAAENRGMTEGCDLMMRLAREAGFGSVAKMPTDGQPRVFATLDAGAPRAVGLYFMYHAKQADSTGGSAPPWGEARARPAG